LQAWVRGYEFRPFTFDVDGVLKASTASPGACPTPQRGQLDGHVQASSAVDHHRCTAVEERMDGSTPARASYRRADAKRFPNYRLAWQG
jgi:hypothetical protein